MSGIGLRIQAEVSALPGVLVPGVLTLKQSITLGQNEVGFESLAR